MLSQSQLRATIITSKLGKSKDLWSKKISNGRVRILGNGYVVIARNKVTIRKIVSNIKMSKKTKKRENKNVKTSLSLF